VTGALEQFLRRPLPIFWTRRLFPSDLTPDQLDAAASGLAWTATMSVEEFRRRYPRELEPCEPLPVNLVKGDLVTFTGRYRRRTFWQWLRREPRQLLEFTVY
jgi:hypothetical protein